MTTTTVTTTTIGRFRAPRQSAPFGHALVERLRVPLEAWSTRRRLVVGLLIAAAVLTLGVNAWTAADMSGLAASRGALQDARRKLREAQAVVASLPALRRAAPVVSVPAGWSSADDARVVSDVAATHNMTLVKLQPGAVAGSGLDASRPLVLNATTRFADIAGFIDDLTGLPVLVVPDELTLKQQGAALSVSASLRSFAGLHPVRPTTRTNAEDDPDAIDPDEELLVYDPFLPQSQAETPDALSQTARLVGLLADGMRGLALIDSDEGAVTLEAGQQWGAERVASVSGRALTFARRDGSTHSLTLAEADE